MAGKEAPDELSKLAPELDRREDWGWLCGKQFVLLPKLPLLNAGMHKPPFNVTRPDGTVIRVIKRLKKPAK